MSKTTAQWTTSVVSGKLMISYKDQPILGKITAAEAAPGGELTPMSAGKPTAAGIPFGRDLFVHAAPAGADGSVLILRARHCGKNLDGQKGMELRVGDWGGVKKVHVSYRYKRWWCRPAWPASPDEIPAQTQFLLAQRTGRGGRYLAILPLTDGGMRGELRTGDGHGAIASLSCDSRFTPCSFAVAAVAVGADPQEVTQRVIAAGLAECGVGRLRSEKPVPPFVEQFGWCSWNAFYQNVTEKDVVAALNSFLDGKLPVGAYILDDGWQDTAKYSTEKHDGETHEALGLKSFQPNQKFSQGLAPLIERIKSKTGLKYFGVWHAFQGYWGGLHPEGELFGQYETYSDVWGTKLFKPKDGYRFYQDYHSTLRDQGVDFVKIDNQSSLEGNIEDSYAVGHAARQLHQGLDGSVATNFLGQVINCMSMSSDIMLQLPASNVVRNSDDYFPSTPNNPGEHVAFNAYNNLWTARLAIPDWDMFESHHPYGQFHAMARAISGSPIYCTDTPGKQDFKLLRKLVLSDGRALRCPAPAQVTDDCLMVDVLGEPTLLKIQNLLPTGHGLLGIFNCRVTPEIQHEKSTPYTFTAAQRKALSASAEFAPADVKGLEGDRFAVFSHRTGTISVMAAKDRAEMELIKFDADVLVLAPIENDAAALGLIDKYNSPAAIEAWGFDGNAMLTQLIDGGQAGFYCRRKPRSVRVNDKAVKTARYDKATGLLTLRVRTGKPAMVELRW